MEDIKKVLAFYRTKLSNQIAKLSEALHTLQLDGFWYSYVHNDGGFFQIGNTPEVAEIYFSNHLYVHNSFVCHPKNYQHNQIIITDGFPDEKFHQAQKVVGDKLGIQNILFIYKQCGDHMHCLHFSSSKPNIPLNSIFLNNSSLLCSFADYFLEEWRPNFRFMDSFMIDIASDMGSKFYEINPKIQQLRDHSKALKLLKKMGELDEFSIEELTARELECAAHYLLGKTAGQIATSMHIARRTAEHHIENIKSKLGCSTKLELFDKLQTLQKFNLIGAPG